MRASAELRYHAVLPGRADRPLAWATPARVDKRSAAACCRRVAANPADRCGQPGCRVRREQWRFRPGAADAGLQPVWSQTDPGSGAARTVVWRPRERHGCRACAHPHHVGRVAARPDRGIGSRGPISAPPLARSLVEEIGVDPPRLRIPVRTRRPDGERPHPECVAAAERRRLISARVTSIVTRKSVDWRCTRALVGMSALLPPPRDARECGFHLLGVQRTSTGCP
jgi:hypothetical protein